jgi:hypothetical protein
VIAHASCAAAPIMRSSTVQDDRSAIRHDQSRPHQEHAVLSERDLAVVHADKLRSLRYEQIFSGWTVVDALRDLGGDLAGKIRTNAGDQCCRNDGAGLDDIA